MADVDRGAADHLAAARALMPTGAVWPRHPGTTQDAVLGGLVAGVARLRARARGLLVDAFPGSALELLADWELTVGLPDPCTGTPDTVQQRRAGVVARVAARGGQSVPYLVGVAAAAGFAVTIEEHAPARAGVATAGSPVGGEAWAHALTVRAPADTVTEAQAGAAVAGEPLRSWGNGPLECALSRLRPAHTVIRFLYGT
ncbi:YmfQ family protein [Falsiroseomonas sp. CW058]|uniref:YmfQ family protein n=1 Tax=Falsiroseomonas sp. CW058 TaxID=3388664 RepID=UPI003D320A93